MENQAQTKHVTNGIVFSFHVLNVDNFRGDIPWSTTSDKKIFFSIAKFSQSIIGNNAIEGILVSEKQVFGLEISVHDFLVAHFFHSQKNAMDNGLNFVIFEFIFGLDLVMETSAAQKLKDNVKRVFGFEDFEKPHVVWMAEVSHDFNFLNETLLALFFRVSGFFGKGLNSVSVFILMFFDKIN